MNIPLAAGVSLSDDTAADICAQAERWGISVSVHAPYYINLANPDPEKREASFRYILDSARKAVALGGQRVVVHVGAAMKMERSEALTNCRAGLIEAYRRLEISGWSKPSFALKPWASTARSAICAKRWISACWTSACCPASILPICMPWAAVR